MPILDFKGKQYIYAHHLSVPFRQLNIDQEKSMPINGHKSSIDDNLIIHGDNLHGLKALLPKYAGKVKCIYIDPPYNTGNEGWCYNDNVNSALMKEWLDSSAKPVDSEDMERHDKWLCMMWPRLQLLKELLAEDGVIFVSIDDNEYSSLKLCMDEIFGRPNFLATFVWKRRASSGLAENLVSTDHEYVLSYKKPLFEGFAGEVKDYSNYKNPDNDPRGDWTLGDLTVGMGKDLRPNQFYDLVDPDTKKVYSPNPNRVWAYAPDSMKVLLKEKKIFFPADTSKKPMLKRFKSELKRDVNPISTWINSKSADTNNTDSIIEISSGLNTEATKALQQIFENNTFAYSKPMSLISALIKNSTGKNDIILDSFAGSGTTAHAVLSLNKQDGGNRKFILIEMEDYASSTTAERIRRVAKGLPGAKDKDLQEGLGGSFSYCELGESFEIDKILTGESLPSYNSLAQYIFYTATGQSLSEDIKLTKDYFVGETELFEVYLIYKDDLAYLRSNESALNQEKMDIISEKKSNKQKIVFATAKYMSQSELTNHKIIFCQIPYAIHKIAGN